MKGLRWAVLLAPLLLAACQSVPVVPETAREQAWRRQAMRLTTLDGWELAGRMAVRAEGGAWNLRVRWRHRREGDRIVLAAPLGGGAVRITAGPGEVVVESSRGEVRRGADASVLLAELLGVRVPVRALRHWVLGLPMPGLAAERRFDAAGRLIWLRQDGWEVRYRGHREVAGLALPRRLEAAGGGVVVRLVVERWTLPAGAGRG